MTDPTPILRVLTSVKTDEGLQIVSAYHNTADRTGRYELRLSPEGEIRQFVVDTQAGLDVDSWRTAFKLPVIGSAFLTVTTWFLWRHLEAAIAEGVDWRPGTESGMLMEPGMLLRFHRTKVAHASSADDVVTRAARTSARFGLSTVIDPLFAIIVGIPFERLRLVVMNRRGSEWEVREEKATQRLELEPTGAFRATHGILESYELTSLLGAPRYRGVLEYWNRAIGLRRAVPPDVAGCISNAAHAVEALARIAVGDSSATAGVAISTLVSAGRLDPEVGQVAKTLHGRTSGGMGARHGHPNGPTEEPSVADYYLDLLGATIRQLLAADVSKPPYFDAR